MACGQPARRLVTPSPVIGASAAAEARLRPVIRRWVFGSASERQRLDEEMGKLAERFPDDTLAVFVQVLRAWNALERGELLRAKRLSKVARLGAAGVSRDLATVVLGAVQRRSLKPRRALVTLRPLLQKMIDPFATTLLTQELVLASIAAKRWTEALHYIEVWHRQAPAHGEQGMSKRASAFLKKIPPAALFRALRERAEGGRTADSTVMAKRLAQQLALVVIERRESQLARTLIDRYGPLLGRYGEAVARLASSRPRARVLARTVGVLMATNTSDLRRRSSDVVVGMTYGLNIPGSSARLVTREAGQDEAAVRRSLAALAAEGAAVIVAGIHPGHNALVAAFSADRSLPVVLLGAVPPGALSPFVFQLGEDPGRSVAALVKTLHRAGGVKVAGFGGIKPAKGALFSDIELGYRCHALPSAQHLRAAGIGALLLYDGAHCSREVAQLAAGLQLPLGTGLGVLLTHDKQLETYGVAAGVFSAADQASVDPRLKSWFATGRKMPTWWMALGRDAAVLAWQAVQHLAETGTDELEVKARRVEATSALAAARTTLWTSDTRGFGSHQRVVRPMRPRRMEP